MQKQLPKAVHRLKKGVMEWIFGEAFTKNSEY